METATFAMGCFWSPELLFSSVQGVQVTAVGFMGGRKENPTYEDVCYSDTGHAEVVQVTFDPRRVNYEQLLGLFWSNHNPTTRNRQGPDVGSQYRSAIFYHSEEQRTLAEKSKAAAQAAWSKPVVTEIVSASTFWKAEEYHQQYLHKRGKESCGL